MSIFIFSQPIHSGKTTALLNWCNDQQNIAGVLMPDIDGSRKIYNIETQEILDMECINMENNTASLTIVGRFNFYTAAFEKANEILLNAWNKNPAWLIIDEAGKLELEGKGFYSSLVSILNSYNSNSESSNLLIIVRDSLCNDVISFFKIEGCKIIGGLQELGQYK